MWRRQLVSKQLFAEHFWWVYNRLQSRADGDYTTAAYFRFMTLLGPIFQGPERAVQLLHRCALSADGHEHRSKLAVVDAAAFRVFLMEKVDVVILEVGLGGRLDATNCVPQPVVCGVSALGYDHMELLGNTLMVREI